MTALETAYHGSLIADAFAMPVHWYYNREAIDEDYPELITYHDPLPHHPDSILWRSQYKPIDEKAISYTTKPASGDSATFIITTISAPEKTPSISSSPKSSISKSANKVMTRPNGSSFISSTCELPAGIATPT